MRKKTNALERHLGPLLPPGLHPNGLCHLLPGDQPVNQQPNRAGNGH